MDFGIPPLFNEFQIKAQRVMTSVAAVLSFFKEDKVYALIDKDGNNVLSWDSCINFEYKKSSTISNAPLESGAFVSYNKVASPSTITARGTKLKKDERADFIDTAKNTLNSLELYTFITPDQTYRNVNLISISNAKTSSSGYSIAAIDFIFHEVVINNLTRRSTDTAKPSGAKKISLGQVVAK